MDRERDVRREEREVTGNTEEVPIELIIIKIAINNEWNGRDQLVKLTDFIPPTNAHAFQETLPSRILSISLSIPLFFLPYFASKYLI